MAKGDYQKLVNDKKKTKQELFPDLKSPLLVVFAPTEGEAKENFFQLLEGLLILPIKIVVVSENSISDSFHSAGKITWLNPENGRMDKYVDKYLMAADMALVFHEDMNTIKNLMGNGVVIIGLDRSPLLDNYHPNDETGNSFTFDSLNPWDIFRAIVRAHETYRFPYDWGNIIRCAID